MNVFKRILAIILSVCILTLTVGTDYFDSSHIKKVEATEVVVVGGVTAATLFQVCLFVGGVVATCYVAGEVIDNKEEIARAGKNFIDSVKDIPEGWILSMSDVTNGQEYVFGSEAFELVQDTAWEVIQGGGGSNNNNDDDNNDEKKGIIDLCKSAGQYVGNLLPLGATWLVTHASNLYQKWVNGEELTETETAVLEPLITGYCNQYDIAEQWSGEPTLYSSYIRANSIYNEKSYLYEYNLSVVSKYPVCASLQDSYGNPSNDMIVLHTTNEGGGVGRPDVTGTLVRDSVSGVKSQTYNISSVNLDSFSGVSYSLNFPVFFGYEAAANYLRTGNITDALNYAHVYREADWLSDNWAGQLIDPLTNIGLTLSQLLELMKALGLNAIGNNLSPAELLDLLRRSLPAVNPELLPGESPVIIPQPAPGIDPIYYPSPGVHPLPDPGTDPKPKPDPGTEPDPDVDPVDEVIDIPTVVPDVVTNFSDISGNLKYKFPFSIPWDLHYLFTVLADTPKTPIFKLPLVIKRYGIHETVVIDMTDYKALSDISRLFFSLLYAYGLISWTVKIVSVRKEE